MYMDLGDFAERLDGVQDPFVLLNHYNHPVSDGEIPWPPHNIPLDDEGAGWHMALTQQVFEALQQVPLGFMDDMVKSSNSTGRTHGLFQDMEWP